MLRRSPITSQCARSQCRRGVEQSTRRLCSYAVEAIRGTQRRPARFITTLVLTGCTFMVLTAANPSSAVANVPRSISSTQAAASSGSPSAQEPTAIVPYGAGGYSFKVVQHGDLAGFQSPTFDAAAAGFQSDGNAPFGSGCRDSRTDWPANTDLLVRKEVTVPPGAEGITVSLAIDNDDVVYWNGTQIGSGTHEGCASGDSYAVPAALAHSGPNLLAVRGIDRGVATYLDVTVQASVPVSDPPLSSLGMLFPSTGVVGHAIDVEWQFSDADPDALPDDFAASITWGDGTTSSGTISSTCLGQQCFFLVGDSHSYAKPGTYAATAHVTDLVGRNDGGGSTVDIPATVQVRDTGLGSCAVDDPGRGFRIESVGDALDARNVAIIVPGVQNDYSTFPTLRTYALHVSEEIRRLYRSQSASSAVVAWLGYNPPDFERGTLQEAVTSGNAQVGAKNLVAFLRCLRANRRVPHFTLTVIGHSYGSVVVGRAAEMCPGCSRRRRRRGGGALDGDNVVFVGSPGVDADNVQSLGRPKAVYAGENPNDFIQLFTSPVVQYLSASEAVNSALVCNALVNQLGPFVAALNLCRSGVHLAHGPDPTSSSFGARHFSTAGECGHSYFDDAGGRGTEGLANVARIAMGDGRRVTPERRAPIAPFTVHVTVRTVGPLPVGPPEITGLSVNWTVDCTRSSQADGGAAPVDVANYDATGDVLSAAGIVFNLKRKTGSKRQGFSMHAFARARESVSMTLYASGRRTRSADVARARRAMIVIASGHRALTHAGRWTVRLHLTSAGRRYLAARKPHGRKAKKKLRLRLGVLVRTHGRLGYFAGPVTVRIPSRGSSGSLR
jgi:hypothetical protein